MVKRISVASVLANLPIFRKGLLLTLLPVTFQFIAVVLFIYLQNSVIETRKWMFHSIDVVATTDDLRASLGSAYYSSLLSIFLSDVRVESEETDHIKTAITQIERLNELVVDNKEQGRRLSQIESSFSAFLAVMKKLDFPASTSGPERAEVVRKIFSESVAAKEAFDTDLERFRQEELRLQELRKTQVNNSLARASWTVMGGYVFLVCFSGFIYLIFQEAISSRVESLMDDLALIEKGEVVTPTLQGEDEIAQLGEAIHLLSNALSEKALETEMFLYSVSHDLRSPLVNLSGFTDELKLSVEELKTEIGLSGDPRNLDRARKILDKDFEKSFTFIRAAVSRLSKIIDGLLRLSRAGRVKYKNELVDLRPLVQRLVDSLDATLRQKGIRVEIGELPSVYGDEAGFEQIFSNLLSNAVAYSDPKRPGEIQVGTEPIAEPPDGFMKIYVKDNGRGISESAQKKLFLAFHRFHPDVTGGEGVGLALVRRVVVSMNGKIDCQSEEGIGTTFSVSLPTSPRRMEAPRSSLNVFPNS